MIMLNLWYVGGGQTDPQHFKIDANDIIEVTT
jgi:hypothetical protein